MTAYRTLIVEKQGSVDWVTMNRPDALNAMNPALVDELQDYFGRLYTDHSVRVVVLKGAGRAFCAGLDLKERSNRPEADAASGSPQAGLVSQRRISEIVMRMRRCPQPIISLVHGPACGGGFALALASDIRIAGESARMNAAFIRIGLSACDIGVSYFLPRLVGVSVASELMMTGRFINAARAERVGLVSEVVPDAKLAEAAAPYIEEMLTTSPLGLRLTKECLNMSVDAGSLEAAVAMEDRNQILCAQTNDFREGIAAFLGKRRPDYTNS
ncbi:enoyl-CoA hydratase/isomerase family protein [uncultured Parvibaculum sp.]|uniref:enoyl-CoA hydratase/isomerase family protein n=1 Tax=uncultured Parvibaculum sp. TaxID=291828 RepID=UPI0030D73D6A|tara:strand:- start:163953 stop:164765 length:813 start_codon:yes stop_codon:yes gene_type:complete